MKKIEMSLDDRLIHDIDAIIQKLGVSRADFADMALRQYLLSAQKEVARKNVQAEYEEQMIYPDEFDSWYDEY